MRSFAGVTFEGMDRSELGLLEAAQQGDDKALDQLLAQHEPHVYRFGLRMCGDEDSAREVLQETLLAAFRGLREFRGDASLSTWLYQIARSFCVKTRRRGAGEPAQFTPLDSPDALAVEDSGRSSDEHAHAREVGAAIQAALLALPEPHREAVVLRDVEGLSAEEAAKVAGIEVGALKTRLHRGRLELRDHLSSLFSPPGERAAVPCPDLAEALAACAEAEIDQETCARIERHLSECKRCASVCDSLKRIITLCSRIPGDAVPAPVVRAVRQALRVAVGESSPAPSGSH
jgi:RNA polymerase sigma-70 factor (ECF subfamily)